MMVLGIPSRAILLVFMVSCMEKFQRLGNPSQLFRYIVYRGLDIELGCPPVELTHPRVEVKVRERPQGWVLGHVRSTVF